MKQYARITAVINKREAVQLLREVKELLTQDIASAQEVENCIRKIECTTPIDKVWGRIGHLKDDLIDEQMTEREKKRAHDAYERISDDLMVLRSYCIITEEEWYEASLVLRDIIESVY